MADGVEVGFVLPVETAHKLAQIEGVERVLAGIVDFMDRRINDIEIMDLIDRLTRRVALPGYQAMQHGQRIWSRPDDGD